MGSRSRHRLRVAMIAYTRYRTDARVRREAEALAARGDEVICFCVTSGGPRIGTVAGVKVVELPLLRYRGGSAVLYLLSYSVFLLLAAGAVLAAHLGRRCDIVQVHNLPDFMVLAALPARALGARVILDMHDTSPETFASKFNLPLSHPLIRTLCVVERLCTSLADRTIAVHELQRDLLASRGTPASRLAVVLNSPDERLFRARPPASVRPGQAEGRGRVEDDFHVFYHGTIARRHGVDLLVQAVASLTDKIPSLRLTVCGEGDDLSRARQLASELGLRDRVLFTGMLPLEEMASRLATADLEVIPLRRDLAAELMLPVKALEAIACGVPVACSENPALRRHFGADAILFFEPGSAEAIGRAIHMTCANPAEAGARAARASRKLAGYAWKHQSARYLEIVDALAGGRRGRVPGGVTELPMQRSFRIYPNVTIGPGAVIEDYAIIGRPPAGSSAGEHPTIIGAGAVIRSHTVIYAGNVIGDGFQTGHGALIREHNAIGSDVSVGSGSVVEHHVTVGDRVRIHSQAFIPETTVLEEECWIGPNVVITNAYHPLCPRAKDCLKGARVERGAKIGANATLLPDIIIGHDALVGAGSVVVSSVPPGVVVGGVPARVIKQISDLTCPYELIERPYDPEATGELLARRAVHADPPR